MTEGFQKACLDVEVVVQKMLQDDTTHDWAFSEKDAQDLDLWTAALLLVLENNEVPAAEREKRWDHAHSNQAGHQ